MPDEKPNVQLQPIDHKNTSHVFQDEIIASLGVSLGAGIGILANNLVIGLCCAVILYLLARVFSYKRTKNRDQQEK